MKKRSHAAFFAHALIFLVVLIFAVGCDETQTPAEYQTVTLTYRSAFEYSTDDAIRFSNTVSTDGGYRFAYSYASLPTQTREYDAGIMLIELDTDGTVLHEEKLTEHGDNSADMLFVGERGLYVLGLYNDYESGKTYRGLFRYSFDGTREMSAAIADIRGDNNDLPINGHFLSEYDDGVLLILGDECIFLNDSFEPISEFKLPENAAAAFFAENELWVEYSEDDTAKLGNFSSDGNLITVYTLPEAFCSVPPYYQPASIIEMRDGYLYAWDYDGVFRWKITDDTDDEPIYETVMDFADSWVVGESVRTLSRLCGNEYDEYMIAENYSDAMCGLYRPVSDGEVLTETMILACISPDAELKKSVLEFNKSRLDIRVEIIDYDMYNTADDWNAGRDRLLLDLTTGVLEPDILVLDTGNYKTLCESADGYFINLYTLMTDGEVSPDTIYGCVKNTLEAENGELYGIATEFSLSSLVGKRDVIGSADSWSVAQFLDFAENIEDGEYLMEEISGSNAEKELFGSLIYAPFMRNGKADFCNSEFLRLLEFLKSLPTEEQTYMEHGSSNIGSMYAGEITEDEVYVAPGGENLYFNGKIKLKRYIGISSLRDMLNAAYEFGVENPAELNFIGYPIDDMSDSGVIVKMPCGIYAIPSCTDNAKSAWEFIEQCMLSDVFDPTDEVSYLKYGFKTYKPYTDDYLSMAEGYQVFYTDVGGRIEGKTISDEILSGQGKLCVIDGETIERIRRLFDTAGVPFYYSLDNGGIVNEEISRYLAGYATSEDCANVINSRVGIWLEERK